MATDFACWCWYIFNVLYIWILSTPYDTDAILTLELSFFLSQQKDLQPILSAAEKYNALNISTKVEAILQEVYMQHLKEERLI